MARSASSFDRAKPRFRPQPRTLVLCEDSKSCLLYLKDAAQHFRSYAEIEVANCGKTDPKGIVTEAVNLKRRQKFDDVICVIDRDSHHGFQEALELAAQNLVGVVASYPCYEFWLLLHFRKTRAPYMPAGDHSAAERVSRSLRQESGMDKYEKGAAKGLFISLLDRLPDARTRSMQVLTEALADGEMNPSTRLHELIEAFEALGKLQPLT